MFRTTRYQTVADAIRQIKAASPVRSEMKWSKYKGGHREAAYKGLVELAFSLIEQKVIHFHCLIAKFDEFVHKAFEGGKPESSVNRMYFQLLTHRICRYYSKHGLVYVYPDQGEDSSELLRYHGEINKQAASRYRVPHRLIEIEPSDSAKCNVLQMVDVIIGGIAYSLNNDDPTSAYKADLAKFIQEKSGHEDWKVDTKMSARKFTVWNFLHQKLTIKPAVPQGARRIIRHG